MEELGLSKVNLLKCVKDFFKRRFKTDSPLAFVKVFGCQQNEADTEKIKGFLFSVGFKFVDEPFLADFILFNTCAVRHTAENRILSHIGNLKKLKKMNPNVFISICGCMVEQESILEIIRDKYPYVDFICGAKSVEKFPELLYEKITGQKIFDSNLNFPVYQNCKFESWIPIISGCNNFCSYCIVPYVRGREKSVDYRKILNDCKSYVENGSKIITLLGQNVNSYSFEDVKFPDLLKTIDKIDGDFTLRFMTSHPKDFNENLVDVLSECKHFSGHLHLPVQSGNDRILKLMNRKYKIEQYIEKVKYARKKLTNLVVTSDIIVGFPGETEKEFEDTIDLIKKLKFASVFSFVYSPRKGTLAYEMGDSIPHEEKIRRISYLIETQAKISEDVLSDFVGKNLLATVENVSDDVSLARTDSNLLVKIDGKFTPGDRFYVKILKSGRNSLFGAKI